MLMVRGMGLLKHVIPTTYGQEKVLGAEIGVAGGFLSSYLLRNDPRLYLCMIDIWSSFDRDSSYYKHGDSFAKISNEEATRYRTIAIKNTEFAKSRRRLIQKESEEASKEFNNEDLDFVFMDADCSYEGRLRDLNLWYPKVREGGIIAGGTFHLLNVKQAIYQFLKDNYLTGFVDNGNCPRGGAWWAFHKPKKGSNKWAIV